MSNQEFDRRLTWIGADFWPLTTILVLYLFITIGYGVINPLFEAPDEHWHYFTAQFIAENGRLPIVGESDYVTEWLGQEAAQPPLTYLLGALLIKPIDTTAAPEQLWLNPYAQIGNAAATANINRFVHPPAEDWPWSGYALAAHFLRLFSTLLGFGTLLGVYGSGRFIFPHHSRSPLVATGLAAFLPQFNFIHASVANDAMITFLSTAVIWQLLRLWHNQISTKRLVLLGITIGLAALTKNAGILLLVYALGVLFLIRVQEARSFKERASSLVRDISIILIIVFSMAGWLWWRNWTLYGDFTAANQFILIAGGDRNYTLWQVLAETKGLWQSLFAVFGWFNIVTPEWVYYVWNGLAVMGVLGFLAFLRLFNLRLGIRDWRLRFNLQSLISNLLLPGWLLAVYAGLVMFMLQTEAAQGRLLFPAIVPLALGLAGGLGSLKNIRYVTRNMFLAACVALGFITTVACLFFVIRPIYARPHFLDNLPDSAQRLDADVGKGLTLVGADVVEQTAVSSGDDVEITLFWRREGSLNGVPEDVVSIFGRDLMEIGKQHSYHGRGLYPAIFWPQGQLIAEQMTIQLDEFVEAPVLARVGVSIVDSGESVTAVSFKITPAQWPNPAPELAVLNNEIALTRAALTQKEDRIIVDVQWQAIQDLQTAYTVLLHVGDPQQPPLAAGDRPPLDGDYPTHVWEAGEVIEDQMLLLLPQGLENGSHAFAGTGRYPVWIGMYDSKTIERLPLTVDGERNPQDVYLLGFVEIRE